ncbi:MAG: hypothetical protein ACKVS8_02250 [Phycisphaerales bacterium]
MVQCKAMKFFSVAAMAAVLGGCSLSDPGYDYYGGWETGQAPPKPMARAEKAAPAPAPAAKSGCGSAYRPNVPAGSGVSSMAFPTGDLASSGLWIHQVSPTQVRAGQPYTMELHATNLTNATLQNVMVSNKSVTNMSMSASTPAGSAAADGSMTWALGDLGVCETKVIKITGKADKVGQASNCLSASFNNALCMTVNVVEPSLRLTKTITPEATPCDPVLMTFEVTNTGTGIAESVVIKDQLPAGLTVDGKQMLEMAVGNLGPGESKRMTATGKAAKAGKYDNMATAMGAGGLEAKSATVSSVIKQPVLAITADCPPGGAMGRGGRDFTFKFTVANKGDAACNAMVSAPVPSGSTFVSADSGGSAGGNAVSWNVGSLAAGASKTVAMTVRANIAGAINAMATASCPCAEAVSANCGVTTTGVPDIGTQITDDDGVIELSKNHNFRYEVKNQGLVDLTNVKMVATFDADLDFVSTDWPAGAKADGKTVTWMVGTLRPGDVKKVNIVSKASKVGQLVIRTITTSDQTKEVRNDEQVNYVQ